MNTKIKKVGVVPFVALTNFLNREMIETSRLQDFKIFIDVTNEQNGLIKTNIHKYIHCFISKDIKTKQKDMTHTK